MPEALKDRCPALLLLDLQNEMVDPKGKIGAHGLAQVVADRNIVRQAAQALQAFRAARLPVFHVRLGFRADYGDSLSQAPRIAKLKEQGAAIAGTWGTEFPAALAPRANEIVITKSCVNPFFNTGLLSQLHARKVDEVVLGGVVTNLVVETTARYADDAGFRVTVLEDLCAAPSAAWHEFSVTQMLPLFGRVLQSADYLGSLDR
jgi:nicotinamidase-related amidase